MDEARVGAVIRTLRTRKRWRQADLALIAGVSRGAISKIERGHAAAIPMGRTMAICRALDVHLDLLPRWRGGDLGRLLNARHAVMAESVAASFGQLSGWVLRPEVSFSIYGERGVVDFVAWHPIRRALLLIELKTELVDIGELMSTADRRRRLATRIGRDQDWHPDVVGTWVIVLESTANASRIRAHRTVLRAAFPSGGRVMGGWLRDPATPIGCLSLRSMPELRVARVGSVKRVRRPRDNRGAAQIEAS